MAQVQMTALWEALAARFPHQFELEGEGRDSRNSRSLGDGEEYAYFQIQDSIRRSEFEECVAAHFEPRGYQTRPSSESCIMLLQNNENVRYVVFTCPQKDGMIEIGFLILSVKLV